MSTNNSQMMDGSSLDLRTLLALFYGKGNPSSQGPSIPYPTQSWSLSCPPSLGSSHREVGPTLIRSVSLGQRIVTPRNKQKPGTTTSSDGLIPATGRRHFVFLCLGAGRRVGHALHVTGRTRTWVLIGLQIVSKEDCFGAMGTFRW